MEKEDKRGKPSKYSHGRIYRTVDYNPRRRGSNGFNSFALIVDGMTYDEYIEKGGRLNDLDWDVKNNNVEIRTDD